MILISNSWFHLGKRMGEEGAWSHGNRAYMHEDVHQRRQEASGLVGQGTRRGSDLPGHFSQRGRQAFVEEEAERVTIAAVAGQRVASSAASTFAPNAEPAGVAGTSVAAVETGAALRVNTSCGFSSSSSSSNSEKKEMEGSRPPIPVADLEAGLFRGLSLLASVAMRAAVADVSTSAPVSADVPIPTPVSPPSAGARQRPVEVSRERTRAEKRPRTEATPSSDPLALPSSNTAGASQPPESALWRPDFEVVPGRQLTVDDRIGNDDGYVVSAVGRACALPRDMERLRRLDDLTLLGSTMRSAISIVQKCQVGMERLYEAHTQSSELEEERNRLQAALDASDQKLEEVVGRHAALVDDLDTVTAEVNRLKEEKEVQEKRAAELEAALEKQKAEFETALEKQKAELEAALEKQKAELEAALEKQKAESEAELEKQKAEFAAVLKAKTDKAYIEGANKVTALYEVQVFTVSQKVWRLGCLAALEEAGVPKDHPAYQNPPKLPSSDPGSSYAPGSVCRTRNRSFVVRD